MYMGAHMCECAHTMHMYKLNLKEKRFKITIIQAGMVAHWMKSPAAKADHLSLIPVIYMVGESRPPEVVLWPPYVHQDHP